jgi:hypothetical protein
MWRRVTPRALPPPHDSAGARAGRIFALTLWMAILALLAWTLVQRFV